MTLDQMVTNAAHGVPVTLLANQLALTAATATSKLEGRMARQVDIRDAYHLTPPGEARGPDGDLLHFWRKAVRLRVKGRDWQEGMQGLVGPAYADDVLKWGEVGTHCARTHGPLAGSVAAMRAVLKADDRAERMACLLSDIILARTLGWPSLLPVAAQYLTKAILRELAAQGQGGDLKVQQRLLASVENTIQRARDLASRASALRAVTSKLRARGSDAAVALFLTEDAVGASSMLSPMIRGTTISMTDRAARRFCDRLVQLGVAHELTGRSTFRLYGIAR